MAFPPAAVVLPAELPASAFDGADVGFAFAGTGEEDPEVGVAAADAADVPPRLLR
jgi:hypothetical protein